MTLPASYQNRLETLVLLRLSATSSPVTASKLEGDLSRYYTNQLGVSTGEWRDLFDQSIQALKSRNALKLKPLEVTESGRAEVTRSLKFELPGARLRWPVVRNRYLIAHALGIRPQTSQEWSQLGTAEGLRAAVLAKHFDLPTAPVPTPARALHALAWMQLAQGHTDVKSQGKEFTRDAVLCEVFFAGRPCKDLASRLAALVTRAATTHPDKLRDAVIAAWIQGKNADSAANDRFDLTDFASAVAELARDSRTGRFGDHKVFISHVWNRFRQSRAARGMSRDEFNQRLVEANRAELLTLSCADLVSAMSPDDVQQSEIRLPHASFHFIRTDTQAL